MCIWLTFYFPVSSAQRREKKLNKGTSSTSICKQGSWERSQLEISLPPGTKVEQQGSESWGTVIYILYLSQKPSPCISIHTHIHSVCVNSLVLWPLKHAYSHPSWLRYRRSVTFALYMILHHGETKAILTFCHKIWCALLIGHCTDAMFHFQGPLLTVVRVITQTFFIYLFSLPKNCIESSNCIPAGNVQLIITGD